MTANEPCVGGVYRIRESSRLSVYDVRPGTVFRVVALDKTYVHTAACCTVSRADGQKLVRPEWEWVISTRPEEWNQHVEAFGGVLMGSLLEGV